jgi:hypothetical protein
MDQDVEDGGQDFPQIDFSGSSTRFCFGQQVTQQFIFSKAKVTGIRFTHVALSVLCFLRIYSL